MKQKSIIITAVFILAVGILISYDRYSMNKFNRTELKIDRNQLESIWGKPTDYLVSDNYPVLVYKTPLGFTEYSFKFDNTTGLLIEKDAAD